MNNDPNVIQVWKWEHAPQRFKNLSTNGGDEDWVALVPPSMVNEWIPWLEEGPFGCCNVAEYPLINDGLSGYVIRIGCHA